MRKLFIFFITVFTLLGCSNIPDKYIELQEEAKLYPDYTNIVIPPNIAPLNFFIDYNANKFLVKIYTDNKNKIIIKTYDGKVIIPIKKWQNILMKNKGKNLFIDIYSYKDGQWYKFKTINNNIATVNIEPYIAYRLINHVNILWRDMGIYQRHLESYEETPIFRNRSNNNGCVNCHHFNNSDAKRMSLHFRKENAGTVILLDDELKKIDSKTPYTMSAFSYSAWHPAGKHLAYAVNKVSQIFTSTIDYHEVVFDAASDLVIYNIEKNMITTCPEISSPNRENMPAFSPDGKWLYYISAPPANDDSSKIFAKFSLVRIAYDIESNSWGKVDTVLSSTTLNKSITLPRVSPDGRFVMFATCRYSYFSIFDQTSDLYLYNIQEKTYRPLNEINSPYTESYHTWSQSGKWIIFTSRRLDNCYSRPFIAYFNNGKAFKPFVIPQKDPHFYKYFMKNYNIPELINDKVAISELTLRNFIHSAPVKVEFDSTVDVDALSGATFIYRNLY